MQSKSKSKSNQYIFVCSYYWFNKNNLFFKTKTQKIAKQYAVERPEYRELAMALSQMGVKIVLEVFLTKFWFCFTCRCRKKVIREILWMRFAFVLRFEKMAFLFIPTIPTVIFFFVWRKFAIFFLLLHFNPNQNHRKKIDVCCCRENCCFTRSKTPQKTTTND